MSAVLLHVVCQLTAVKNGFPDTCAQKPPSPPETGEIEVPEPFGTTVRSNPFASTVETFFSIVEGRSQLRRHDCKPNDFIRCSK